MAVKRQNSPLSVLLGVTFLLISIYKTKKRGKMREDWKDRNLSLKEKLARHYGEKKKNIGIPNVEKFNRWAPIFFVTVFSGATVWGVFVIIPHYYGDDLVTVFLLEVFTVYVAIQILINWLCLVFTESTYVPELHGVENIRRVNDDGAGISGYADGVIDGNQLGTAVGGDSQKSTKQADGLGYQVYIPTSVSATKIERKAFPYWSWIPCVICQRPRPPRCHHCTLCDRCVLKRDHHCFFGRNCVGLNNQRFFLYFLLWCVIMTAWGCYQLTPYVYSQVLLHYSYWDFIFPVNICRAVFGYLPISYLHLCLVNLGTMILLFMSSAMFSINVMFLFKGVTSFEHDEKIKIVDTRSIPERLKAVLGESWGLSLLVPGYSKTGPVEDAVYWPYIKVS